MEVRLRAVRGTEVIFLIALKGLRFQNKCHFQRTVKHFTLIKSRNSQETLKKVRIEAADGEIS